MCVLKYLVFLKKEKRKKKDLKCNFSQYFWLSIAGRARNELWADAILDCPINITYSLSWVLKIYDQPIEACKKVWLVALDAWFWKRTICLSHKQSKRETINKRTRAKNMHYTDYVNSNVAGTMETFSE